MCVVLYAVLRLGGDRFGSLWRRRLGHRITELRDAVFGYGQQKLIFFGPLTGEAFQIIFHARNGIGESVELVPLGGGVRSQ